MDSHKDEVICDFVSTPLSLAAKERLLLEELPYSAFESNLNENL